MVDITWIFLLTVFMAINTILWTISYSEVRALHTKEELEEHIDIALDIVTKCRERWPGTAAASHLYSKLAKACLRSYETNDNSQPPSSISETSPSLTDANSPSASKHSSARTGSFAHSQKAFHSPPQFGSVFDQMPEQIPAFDYNSEIRPPQPSFRSNSIFATPASAQSDRRFSYFPPDVMQPPNLPNAWNPQPGIDHQSQMQPPPSIPVPLSNPIIADPTYFMQPTPYSFNPHMFANESYDTEMRSGSLSQEQQIELMQSLESEGISEIDNFMNLSQQYHNPIKSEL